ncbi:MAG: hypothetical protein K940chlam9_01399 [Chlamydiae bacterium]|nr:hypothetical protein [Chlamydiota bacterium]
MLKRLLDPKGHEICYLGLGEEGGALPAFFYFAFSGEESLELDPYSQPALLTAAPDLRVFSFTIPGHGPGQNKFHAIEFWAKQMEQENSLLETFFQEVIDSIHWLIEIGLVDPNHMAVGGLSRGGFVATHIAARDPRIHTILGFAPLTKLSKMKEFEKRGVTSTRLKRKSESLDLEHLIDHLTHVRNFRFYIGNRDTRVGTDICYHFIRQLAEKGHEKRARHQKIELRLTPAIGHQGHGTAPQTFEEGALWVKQQLQKT